MAVQTPRERLQGRGGGELNIFFRGRNSHQVNSQPKLAIGQVVVTHSRRRDEQESCLWCMSYASWGPIFWPFLRSSARDTTNKAVGRRPPDYSSKLIQKALNTP